MGNTLRGYRLVVLSALMLLFDGLHLGGFQLAISSASAEFGLGKTGMGLLVAVQFASIIITPMISGGLADRFGKKPLLVAGVCCMLAGCLAAGLSHRLLPFSAGIFLVGSGGIICESVSSAAISDRYPEQSNRYINLCQFFFSSGAIVGPILLQAILNRSIPWRALYAILGAAFLLLLWPLLRLHLPRTSAAAASSGNPLRFLRSPAYALLFISIIAYVGLENGFGYFAGSLFELGLDAPQLGAYAISAFWAGTAISRLVNSVRSPAAPRLVIVYYLSSAAGLLLMALSRNAALSLAVSFLVGYSYGPIWSALVAMAAGEFPDQSAGAVGLMSTGCGIGGALYPVIMGVMADHMDIHIPFFLLAATALSGVLLGLLYRRRKRR